MSRPNFFCDIDTLNHLIGMEYADDHQTVNVSVDFIDAPFWFLFSADAESWQLKAIQRGEIFSHDENMAIELGTLTVNKATGEGSGNTTDQMLHQNFGAFFQACRNLSFYAQENNWDAEFGGIDPNEAGVMLGVEGDELTYKIVSGKERPDMMCATFFGAPTMGRPYMDDFMENSAFEMMSFEEKLEAAENGDENAMEAVAMAYLNGDEDEEIDEDPEQAVYWFTKLAELDNASAQFNLGLHCAKGHGIKRDFEKAAYWMQRAADNGDEDAPALLEKYNKAAKAVKKIDSGDAQAQADLAGVLMALAGSLEQAGTTDDDYEQAFELAQKSADQNNGDGIWALALCYEHGRGIEQDVDKAVECYRKGAELGHAPSQHSLACYYFRGDVLEEDYEKAFALCMKSAEQGYGLAMRDIGRCYQFGNGVEDDMSLAIEWYEKALEVINDPELEQKVAVFKMLEDGGSFAEDSAEEDDGDGDWGMPDGMMEAMELQDFAEESGYQNNTDECGVFTIGDDNMVAFVMNMANDGNEEAQLVLAKYFLTNECTDEQKNQAIAWIKDLAANGNEDAQDILEDLE